MSHSAPPVLHASALVPGDRPTAGSVVRSSCADSSCAGSSCIDGVRRVVRRTLVAGAALLAAALPLAAGGCAMARPKEAFRGEEIRPVPAPAFSPADRVAAFAASPPRPAVATQDYRIGPGDGLRVTVVGRGELSGAHVVGPDGAIAVPLAGPVVLQGRTRADAAALLRDRLTPWFTDRVDVSVDVTTYANSRVYVLGRVERPGVVSLAGGGTLLQVLAEAGGLPVREFRSFLARCAVVRGRDEILWIDLQALLQRGDLSLNVPLVNGDVVYLPDAADAQVFVMGEVRNPGMVPVRVRLTLAQALGQAGGPGEDADLSNVYVIRSRDAAGAAFASSGIEVPGHGVRRADVRRLLEAGDFSADMELVPGDVVFVGRSGLGDYAYTIRKLLPGVQGAAGLVPAGN